MSTPADLVGTRKRRAGRRGMACTPGHAVIPPDASGAVNSRPLGDGLIASSTHRSLRQTDPRGPALRWRPSPICPSASTSPSPAPSHEGRARTTQDLARGLSTALDHNLPGRLTLGPSKGSPRLGCPRRASDRAHGDPTDPQKQLVGQSHGLPAACPAPLGAGPDLFATPGYSVQREVPRPALEGPCGNPKSSPDRHRRLSRTQSCRQPPGVSGACPIARRHGALGHRRLAGARSLPHPRGWYDSPHPRSPSLRGTQARRLHQELDAAGPAEGRRPPIYRAGRMGFQPWRSFRASGPRTLRKIRRRRPPAPRMQAEAARFALVAGLGRVADPTPFPPWRPASVRPDLATGAGVVGGD